MADTLYFDSKCPVCRREIKWMTRWADNALNLIDIHKSDNLPKEKSALLAIIHLQTQSGEWRLGLDAIVTAWRHTPVGFLLIPLRWPLIKPIADKIYSKWAEQRYCKLSY